MDAVPVDQARDLTAVLRARARPTVAGGDLNTTPGSAAERQLTASGYIDAFDGYRPVLTSPADDPIDEINHLWLGGGLTAERIRVPGVTFSERLPIVIDVR